MYDEIEKGLEKIDNPLVKQTVGFLIEKVEEADNEESSDVAKSALLLYLNAAAPQLLKANVAVEEALTKAYDASGIGDAETGEDGEKQLKKLLAKQGIFFFGPLSKHNTKFGRIGDPRAPGDKRHPKGASEPHEEIGGVPPGGKLESQHDHKTRGPGKREMISFLRDLQELTGADIGSREELKSMNPAKLVQLMEQHAPGFRDNYMKGSGRINRAAAGFGWQNTVQADRMKQLKEYLNSPDAPKRVGREDKGKVKDLVEAFERTPEATRFGRGKLRPKPPADATSSGAEEDKIPEVIHSMNQLPRDSEMWKNFQKLRAPIRREMQKMLAQQGREAWEINAILNLAMANEKNLMPGRSEGNPDPPRWFDRISREEQLDWAERLGIELPETDEERAQREADEEVGRRAEAKRKGEAKRGGGERAVTVGDVTAAVDDAAPEGSPSKGMLPPTKRRMRELAARMKRDGIEKDKALDMVARLYNNMDTVLSSREEGMEFDRDDVRNARRETTNLIQQLRDLGYSDLATYLKDKLNVGETVHAVFEEIPASMTKSDDSVEKFYSRLEKLRSRSRS